MIQDQKLPLFCISQPSSLTSPSSLLLILQNLHSMCHEPYSSISTSWCLQYRCPRFKSPSINYQIIKKYKCILHALCFSPRVLLNRNHLGSRTSHQISNLTLTALLIPSTKTISFAKEKTYTKGPSLESIGELIHH